MRDFLIILINKLPNGYSLNFVTSSQYIIITITNDSGAMYRFKISNEFVTFTEKNICNKFIDDLFQTAFDELKTR